EPDAPVVTLADVGGLQAVKTRLDESFLAPMRNSEIARAFGKSLRGGLLLYGPPGCGKTFLARAVAGELGARFMSVVMTDVLSSYIGQTEKNLKAVFDAARAETPTVLFLDEVDALGMRRGSLTGSASWLRQMVNQLLLEMDSMAGNNDGLYILAATNHPWDLDEALLRPGRLDRTVLVTPPDVSARTAILHYHLKQRPVAGIDLGSLAGRTEGLSGADLEHLCTTAAEKAMMESIAANEIIPLNMKHMEMALAEVKASTLPWLESARNVVRFSNEHGRYDELASYLRSRKML
ncbi:MAG: ATP-binding protein, partial [Micrococcaceae bacterium]|nr:ATP-binding protein [Micrococcaceae bacterium]